LLPPSTISGWVNNSVVTFAVRPTVLIAVILLFVIVVVGVPADVTKIDLIIYVSLTKGNPEPKGCKCTTIVVLIIYSYKFILVYYCH
jgi:hypothetical protein